MGVFDGSLYFKDVDFSLGCLDEGISLIFMENLFMPIAHNCISVFIAIMLDSFIKKS